MTTPDPFRSFPRLRFENVFNKDFGGLYTIPPHTLHGFFKVQKGVLEGMFTRCCGFVGAFMRGKHSILNVEEM